MTGVVSEPRHKSVWRRVIAPIATSTVLIVAGVVAVVMVVVPLIAGATPYTVLTGSMRPTYPPGTLVVVRPVDTDSLGVGTVITYQLRSGEPGVITHRIVAQSVDAQGNRIFTTRGDANAVADADPVIPAQIRGDVWYSVPLLGYVNSFLSRGQRNVLIIVAACCLLAYAVYMFASAGIDSARRRAKS